MAVDTLSGNTGAAAAHVPAWWVFTFWVLFTSSYNSCVSRSLKQPSNSGNFGHQGWKVVIKINLQSLYSGNFRNVSK